MSHVVLSHSGKQHSYQVAYSLHNLEMLDIFYTSSYIKKKAFQKRLETHKYWSRRFINGVSGKKVDATRCFEIPEILLRKALGKHPRVHQVFYYQNVNFNHYIFNIGRRAHPENPKLIADTISDYLAEEMDTEGWEKYLKEHSWKKQAELYTEAIKNMSAQKT